MRGLDSTVGVVALAGVGLGVISLLLCVWMALKLRRVRNDQTLVLGSDRQDIVTHAAELTRAVERLADDLQTRTGDLSERLDEAEERLDSSVSRTAVLRYDALNETSGMQSSSIALLDDQGNGVVVSSILQREQARVYAKPIVGGVSQLDLSPEEEQAIARASRGGAAGPGVEG